MSSEQHEQVVAVKAVIIRSGSVLLLRRVRSDAIDPGKWDLPGGRMRWGEKPCEALKREVYEETKLQIEIGAPLSVWQYKASESLQIVGITFRAYYLNGNVRLSSEHDNYRWVSPSEAASEHLDPNLKAEVRQATESIELNSP